MAESAREALRQQWEHLTIANDFIFCKAMLDKELCRSLLETVLGMPIEHIEYVERQHIADTEPLSKSVRLDVYIRDGKGTVYDVEMQAANDRRLAKRARFYHAQMASEQLDCGAEYDLLPDAFAIFICTFDPFGQGERVYSFEDRCGGRPELTLDDGARTVFLAASAPTDPRLPDELNALLDYVADGRMSGMLSAQLDERVQSIIHSNRWRREYMNLGMRDKDNIERGRKEGAQKLGKLISELLAAGRTEDVVRVAAHPTDCEDLYKEFGIE